MYEARHVANQVTGADPSAVFIEKAGGADGGLDQHVVVNVSTVEFE